MSTEEEEKEWHLENTYVRISRMLMVHLSEGLITRDEFLVLIWLTFNANPNDAMVTTSYDGLVADLSLSGKNAKNRINKIMLNLKQKRYLWYSRMQGRKSNFRVAIAEYMLANGGIKNIEPFFVVESSAEVGTKGRKLISSLLRDYKATTKEATGLLQKSKDNKSIVNPDTNTANTPNESRSTNNDNEKEKKNEKEKIELSNLLPTSLSVNGNGQVTCGLEVMNFRPRDVQEEQMKKIAMELGEKSMTYVCSYFRKYGITPLIEASREVSTHPRYNEPGFQRGAYFNRVLTRMVQQHR